MPKKITKDNPPKQHAWHCMFITYDGSKSNTTIIKAE